MSRNFWDGILAGHFIYEQGIFVQMARRGPPVFGAVLGNVSRANREAAQYAPPWENKAWLADQTQSIFRQTADIGEKLASQQSLLAAGTINEDEPLFVVDRRFVSIAEARRKIRQDGHFSIQLENRHYEAEKFSWVKAGSLQLITARSIDRSRLHPLIDIPGQIKADTDILSAAPADQGGMITNILHRLLRSLGNLAISKSEAPKDSYSRQTLLTISFVGTSSLEPTSDA